MPACAHGAGVGGFPDGSRRPIQRRGLEPVLGPPGDVMGSEWSDAALYPQAAAPGVEPRGTLGLKAPTCLFKKLGTYTWEYAFPAQHREIFKLAPCLYFISQRRAITKVSFPPCSQGKQQPHHWNYSTYAVMPPTEPAILAALSAYRTHIGCLNRRAFSAMIPEIEAIDPEEPDLFESTEELDEARLKFVLRLIDHHPPAELHPAITRPSDLLTHWDTLTPQLVLDGAAVHPDTSWRDEMRDMYKEGVLRGLNEQCPLPAPGAAGDRPPLDAWEFPADLAVVMQHVDSLEGPGWPQFREHNETVIFFERWLPWREDLAERVRTPDEIADETGDLGDDYVIAGGWACGMIGNEATCYVVYCRPRDVRGEEQTRGWSWRYVADLGQYGTHVYEDVVELLEWYKSYSEPREQEWSVHSGEVF